MSERILKALMQLFAIIAKVEINEETNEINSDAGSRKPTCSVQNELCDGGRPGQLACLLPRL